MTLLVGLVNDLTEEVESGGGEGAVSSVTALSDRVTSTTQLRKSSKYPILVSFKSLK